MRCHLKVAANSVADFAFGLVRLTFVFYGMAPAKPFLPLLVLPFACSAAFLILSGSPKSKATRLDQSPDWLVFLPLLAIQLQRRYKNAGLGLKFHLGNPADE